MVEHSTAVREVLGSNPSAPLEILYRHFINVDLVHYWDICKSRTNATKSLLQYILSLPYDSTI